MTPHHLFAVLRIFVVWVGRERLHLTVLASALKIFYSRTATLDGRGELVSSQTGSIPEFFEIYLLLGVSCGTAIIIISYRYM